MSNYQGVYDVFQVFVDQLFVDLNGYEMVLQYTPSSNTPELDFHGDISHDIHNKYPSHDIHNKYLIESLVLVVKHALFFY